MISYRIIVVVGCLLAISAWVNAETNNSPSIGQGTIEISTLGSFAGITSTGSGANFIKASGSSITTLGLSLGYFATKYFEPEGGLYVQRASYSYWGESDSTTITVATGKLAFNYPVSASSVMPYAFGGVGLINSESDSEMLYTFGGGLKIPLAPFKLLAFRVEYSYTNSLEDGGTEGIHSIALAFSAFFKLKS